MISNTYNLRFKRSVHVQVKPWDDSENCIVVYTDGLNDDRAIVLTDTEARALALQLTLAAERINTHD